jgi:hypothetical protein
MLQLCFTPGERAPGTHCIGGWVGPRAGLDAEVRIRILCTCQGSNPGCPVHSQTLYWLSYSVWRVKFIFCLCYSPYGNCNTECVMWYWVSVKMCHVEYGARLCSDRMCATSLLAATLSTYEENLEWWATAVEQRFPICDLNKELQVFWIVL